MSRTCFLVWMFCVTVVCRAAMGYSSDGSTLARSLNRNVSLTNSPVVLSVNFTNNSTNVLDGFFYTHQLPFAISAITLDVSINGRSISNYVVESGNQGDVFAGLVPTRWIIERPPLFGEANPILPGGTVRITYALNSSSAGVFDLNECSWAAMAFATPSNTPPPEVPASGLLALYPCNESNGTSMSNISNSFGWSGSTTLANPDWGSNYVHFQGPGSFAEFNTGAGLSNKMTLAGWFNFKPYYTGDDTCVWLWSPDIYSRNGCIVHTIPSGSFRFRYHNAASDNWTGADLPWTEISPGAWHHVAWVIDLTQGNSDVSIFVDGIQKTLTPYGTGVSTDSQLDPGIWRLASYSPPAGNNCDYSLRMLAIYNRCLSTGDITNLIAATQIAPLHVPDSSFGFAEPGQLPLTFVATSGRSTIAGTMAAAGFKLTVSGVPGYQYAIQKSSDLSSWTSICTNTAPFEFTDSATSISPRSFYRSVQITNTN